MSTVHGVETPVLLDRAEAVGTYRVLVNDEEQYGIHPDPLPAPNGWSEAGFSGTENECVAWVDSRWRDLRPRSLRERESSGGGHRR